MVGERDHWSKVRNVGLPTSGYPYAIALSVVQSEVRSQKSEVGRVSFGSDDGLIWGLPTKLDKIWLSRPPVPEMTFNDFVTTKNDRSTTPIWYVM